MSHEQNGKAEITVKLSTGQTFTLKKVSWYRRCQIEEKNTGKTGLNMTDFALDLLLEGSDGKITADFYKSESLANVDGKLLFDTITDLNVVTRPFLAPSAQALAATQESDSKPV